MSQRAARDGDPAVCVHGTTTLSGASTELVDVNGRKLVQTSAPSGCSSSGGTVITGSGTVLVNRLPAARAFDKTTDGEIIVGSVDVFIGGPTVSIAGAAAAQTAACRAAAQSRKSGRTAQSYGNCPLESWRNVINSDRAARGLPPVSEDELLAVAIDGGYAINDPGKHDHGACSSENLARLLHDRYGIESDVRPQSADGIIDAVGKGQAVSITIHPYHWGSYVNDKWFHEVAVTGVEPSVPTPKPEGRGGGTRSTTPEAEGRGRSEYGPDGQVAAFIINDTGLGICGLRLSVDEYRKNAFPGAKMVVSKDAKW